MFSRFWSLRAPKTPSFVKQTVPIWQKRTNAILVGISLSVFGGFTVLAISPDEVIELRTETSKTFSNFDGSYTREEYTEPIHYQKDGQWLEIDNRFVATDDEDYAYRNAANSFDLYLGATVADGILYESSEGSCQFDFESLSIGGNNVINTQATPSFFEDDNGRAENIIVYGNIAQDVRLEINLQSTGLRTELVTGNYSQLPERIEVDVTACDESIFDTPIVTDDLKLAEIPQSLSREDGKSILSLEPDYDDLGDLEGEVRIDPSINNGPQVDVFTSTTAIGHNRRFLAVGNFYDTTNGAWFGNSESYLRFSTSLPSGAILQSANLRVTKYANGSFTPFTARIGRLTQGINSSTGSSLNDYKSKTGNYANATMSGSGGGFENVNFNVTSLVNAWRSGTTNHGLAIYHPSPSGNIGAAICSSRSDSWCTSDKAPRLTLTYNVNQAPYTPNVTSPANNQTFGGTCNRSVVPATGNCSSTYTVALNASSVGDGDAAPGDWRHIRFYMSRNYFSSPGNTTTSSPSYTYTNKSGSTISNNRSLPNGRYTSYRARSQDNLNSWGNYSSSKTFTIDTQPPATPSLQAISQFSRLSGFDVSADTTWDNVTPVANIDYRLQYSTTSDFSGAVYQTGWQSPSGADVDFQMGAFGPDNTQGTADDFVDGERYYFRVHARDELGNISYNSLVTDTVVDGSIPIVTDYEVDSQRFSPSNPTSTGVADEITFTFEYLEQYGDEARIVIRNSAGNIVRTLTEDLSGSNGPGSPASEGASLHAGNSNQVTGNITLTWDGRDDGGSIVAEGVYSATAEVDDKAAQRNSGLTATNHIPSPTQPLLVVTDDSGSSIQISAPFDHFWTNQTSLNITGQLFEDDPTTLEARTLDSVGNVITQNTCSDGGTPCDRSSTTNIFTYDTSLGLGANYFEMFSQDSVGNQESEQRQVNHEITPPEISNVSIDGLLVALATPTSTNNYLEVSSKQPSVSFTISDPDPTGDQSQQSQLPAMTLPATTDVSIQYSALDNGGVMQNYDVPLFASGVNVEPALVSDIVCNPQSGQTVTTINGLNSAAIVDCSFDFMADLSPDADYTLWITSHDNAGNQELLPDTSTFADPGNPTVAELRGTSFSLDSHTYGEVSEPIDSALYATDTIMTSGRGSRYSALTFNQQTRSQTRSVLLDTTLNGVGEEPAGPSQLFASDFSVMCGFFEDTDSDAQTPDEEVCEWHVLTKAASVNSNTSTANSLIVEHADTSGNSASTTINFDVNLYAVDLTISPDFDFISPNGDGNQDNLIFSHTALNPNSPLPSMQPQVTNYEISISTSEEVILNIAGNDLTLPDDTVVRTLGSATSMPSTTFFDAMICASGGGIDTDGSDCTDGTAGFSWVMLPDSVYDYTLHIDTNSGASITTSEKQIHSFTMLDDSVIITNPIDGFITTSGVVVVQGQAPPSNSGEGDTLADLRGDVTVHICVDMVVPPTSSEPDVSCDFSTESTVDSSGFFSDIVVAPRLAGFSQTTNTITAYASDAFGNTTPISNSVDVIVDTIDPFVDVSVSPALTGLTDPAQYTDFLAGNIDINAIRSVILEANVTQNTEQVQFDFAEFTDMSSLPSQNTTINNGQLPYTFISTVNSDVETDTQLNPLADPNRKINQNLPLGDAAITFNPCVTSQCSWQYPLPIAEPFAGVYEVRFSGKKGSTIQSMTAGFEVDGDIPAAPLLMLIDSQDANPLSSTFGTYQNLSKQSNSYFSNSSEIRVRGAAEPSTTLEIYDVGADPSEAGGPIDVSGLTPLTTVSVASTGIWEAELDLTSIIEARTSSTAGLNDVIANALEDFYLIGVTPASGVDPSVQSTNFMHFVYDTIPPEIVSFTRDTSSSNRIVNSSYESGFETSNSPGFLRSYEYADLYYTASEPLLQTQIIKEDNYTTSLDANTSGNLDANGEIIADTGFRTQITASRDDEGFYYPVVVIKDRAGNTLNFQSVGETLHLVSDVSGLISSDTAPIDTSVYPGKHIVTTSYENNIAKSEQRTLDDPRLYIDNTDTDPTAIDTDGVLTGNWGDGLDGINADKVFPEIGRTNPEYVVYSDEVVITGVAEAGQRVELFIDNKHHTTIPVALDDSGGALCASIFGDTIVDQGLGDTNWLGSNESIKGLTGNLTVKSGTFCQWSHTVNFTDLNVASGSNDFFGTPDFGYLFQVRVRDNAGNTSDWSKTELIYHDTQDPAIPFVDNLPSLTNRTQFNLQIASERESDTVIAVDRIVNTRSFENIESRLYRSPSTRLSTELINLGTSPITARDDARPGCSVADPSNSSRRLGICNDGLYQIAVTSTDAAGNTSKIYTDQTERDTARPFTPTMRANMSGLYTIIGSVSGETSSTSSIFGSLGDDGFVAGTLRSLSVYNDADWERTFTFCSTVTDPADNESLQDCASVTTPIRPPRPGECVPSTEMIEQIEANIRDGNEPGFDSSSFSRSCQTYVSAAALQAGIGDIVSQVQANLVAEEEARIQFEQNVERYSNCVSSDRPVSTLGNLVHLDEYKDVIVGCADQYDIPIEGTDDYDNFENELHEIAKNLFKADVDAAQVEYREIIDSLPSSFTDFAWETAKAMPGAIADTFIVQPLDSIVRVAVQFNPATLVLNPVSQLFTGKTVFEHWQETDFKILPDDNWFGSRVNNLVSGSDNGSLFGDAVETLGVIPGGKVVSFIGKGVTKTTSLINKVSDVVRFSDDAARVVRYGDEVIAFNKNKFKGTNYTSEQYETYVKRKITEGRPYKTPEDYIKTRDYFLNDTNIPRGNAFNQIARDKYFYNEINLETGKRLDSYIPGKEIVSRKATDLSDIQESTFRQYLAEVKSKYAPGTQIRSNAYPQLDGTVLKGDLYLEIPASNKTFDRIDEYTKIAEEYGIKIKYLEE